MNIFYCSKYFNKVLISFFLFGFLLPIEASTYKLKCIEKRSFTFRYGYLTNNETTYKDPIRFKENKNKKLGEFLVTFDLKNNSGSIDESPARAIRILKPSANNNYGQIIASDYKYSPLFLYSKKGFSDLSTNSEKNNYGEIISLEELLSTNYTTWNIRIDDPTKGFTSYFAIKELEKGLGKTKKNNSNEILKDTFSKEKTLEISEGFCNKIK